MSHTQLALLAITLYVVARVIGAMTSPESGFHW